MKKMMKKLLLACVTAAVLISCFCVAASAAVGNGEIDDILEYYDESKIFAFDTFDTEGESGRLTVSRAKSKKFESGLAVIEMQKSTAVSYVVDSLTGSAGANFRFRFDAENAGRMTVDLVDEGGTARIGLTFDFATGSLTYALTGRDGTQTATGPIGEETADGTFKAVTLTTGTYYTLSFFYDKEAKTVGLRLTDETLGTTVVAEGLPVPDFTSAHELTLRLPNKGNDGVTFTLDYAEVYTGSFLRTFEEKQAKTEEAVLALVDLYNCEETTDAQKELLISTIHTVLARGFVATEGTAAYEALYGGDSMGEKIPYTTFAVTFYTQKMIDAVETIDTERSYEERRTVVTRLDGIRDVVLSAGVADPDDDSAYALALAKYRAESAAVEKIRTDAELFITTLKGVVPAKLDYAGCADVLIPLAGIEPDTSYPGVSDLLSVYDQVCALRLSADEKATAFLTATATLANEEESFATRYAAYTAAGESYYTDLSYFVVDEVGNRDTPIADAMALYAAWSTYFDDIVAYNNSFLSYVSRAVYATERSSRLGCIMSAEELMRDADGNLLVEAGYVRAGTKPEEVSYANSVECAMEKLEEMSASMEEDMTAIAAYIKAVNELKAAATIPEKKALLDATKALRVADDLLTVDGVVEANIAFSSIEAEVALWEGNSKLILSSVATLKATKELSDRADLIVKIRAALAALQDKTYAGIADAETYLAAAIKEYNRDVAQMNELFKRQTDAALDVSYSAAPKAIVGVIAWITKENY